MKIQVERPSGYYYIGTYYSHNESEGTVTLELDDGTLETENVEDTKRVED